MLKISCLRTTLVNKLFFRNETKRNLAKRILVKHYLEEIEVHAKWFRSNHQVLKLDCNFVHACNRCYVSFLFFLFFADCAQNSVKLFANSYSAFVFKLLS